MSLNCQKVEIKRIAHTHLASDITNFTSAVCAVFLNSVEFNSLYTTVNINSSFWAEGGGGTFGPLNSANWDSTYSTVLVNSGFWSEAYNSILSNSAIWNQTESSFLTSNSGFWNSTYTTVQNNSTFWNDSYTNIQINSAFWVESYNIIVSNSAVWNDTNNTVLNYSSFWNDAYNSILNNSALWSQTDSSFLTSKSGFWDSVYTTVLNNSALWNNVYNSVNSNSSNWNNSYFNLNSNSAFWNNVYNSVNSNSSNWNSSYFNLNSNSAFWNNVYNSVNSNSSFWNQTYLNLLGNSAFWNNTYTNLLGNSAFWNSVYNSVNVNSGNWNQSYSIIQTFSSIWNGSSPVTISDNPPSAPVDAKLWWDSSNGTPYIWYNDGSTSQWVPFFNVNALLAYFFSNSARTILPETSANWDITYTVVSNNSALWGNSSNITVQNSALWNSTYNTVLNNSSLWFGTNTSVVSSNSGNWNSTFNTLQNNSAFWQSNFTTTQQNSSFWNSVYTNVLNNSANWNGSTNIAVSTNSANWNATYNVVSSTSSEWNSAYDISILNDLYLKQLMGTGLIQGGTITQNADPTKFNIASGYGYIIDNWTNPNNPVFTTVSWNASSGITDLHLGDYITTDLFIDRNGGLKQQIARVSQDDLRDYIFLGRTVHPNLSTITTVASLPHVRTNLPLLIDDLISAIGVINITGNVIAASGANLSLKRSAGSIFRLGSNFTNNPKIPNTTNLPASNPVSLLYRFRNGTGGYSTQTARTTVNPTQWDNGSGILQTIPNKYFSVQRIYQFTTGLTYITYGQVIYDSLVDAVESINSENPDIDVQLNDACLLAYLVIREDATDLTNSLTTKIITAGKFSGTGGSSSGGSGNVTGPLSSTNNSIARFDGTSGSFIKDGSIATIDDSGNAVFAGTITDGSGYNSNMWNNVYSTVLNLSSTWSGTTAPSLPLSSLIIATNVSNGVVNKIYDTSVKPTNMVLISAVTDTSPANVSIHWDGPLDKWMGQPFVSGIAVPLSATEYLGNTSFSRRFSATVPLSLQNGINIIPLKLEGYQKNIQIQLLGAGPEIRNVTFGSFPGTQTELKNGDTISMTVQFDSNDVSQIDTFASNNVYASTAQTYSVTTVSNSATVLLTIATTTNSLLNLPVRLRARNSFGTNGTTVNSNAIGVSATLPINNLAPTFGTFSVIYPASQTALKGTEAATATLQVNNAGSSPTYSYSSPNGNLNIPSPTTYSLTKSVSCTNPGTYNVSGDAGVTNYNLVVTRTENGRSATSSNIVDIADTPAVITVSEPATRLRSGGTNGTSPQQYTITITSSQRLLNAPSLSESSGAGTFVSSWTYSSTAKTFTNTLQVQDTDSKGIFSWNNLLAKNKANTSTTIINGDSNYILGGFVIRTLTMPALSRTVSIGTRVSDSSKVTGDETFRGTVSLSAIPNGTVLNPDINVGINIASRFTIVSTSALNIVNNTGDAIFYLDRVAVNQNVGGTATFTTQETI